MLSAAEKQRYARQISLPDIGVDGQLQLRDASVLCIGAGGLGAPLLLYLTAAGVGKIGIVDADVVEISNLQRQLIFRMQDVGQSKALAAQTSLRQLNPFVQFEVVTEKFTRKNAEQLMTSYDVIVDCTDQLANRYLVNALCVQLGKPFVFAGVWQYRGQCMLFDAARGPCFNCLFPQNKTEVSLPDCDTDGVLGVVPGMLGIMQASLILQYIIRDQVPVNELLTLDVRNLEQKKYHIQRDPACAVCGENKTMKIDVINTITTTELKQDLTDGMQYTLLDVRSEAEHNEFNIGGLHIPLDELPERAHEVPADLPVIIYCRSGKRSAAGVQILQACGYTTVFNLEGGMVSWQACGTM